MEQMKESITIKEQQRKDVLDSFHNAMKTIGTKTSYAFIEEVIKLAITSKAPRFYATVEKARRYISIIDKGQALPLINPNKINMYQEIYNRYAQTKTEGRRGYAVIEDILSQEAPSFYLNERTFRDIVYRKLKKK